MAQEYLTVAQEAAAEFTEKRSRFIATVRPVTTEEEAVSFIQELKSRYWDARHNVYAYRIREGQIQRYSDDGEPQGTAGMPTLDVLQKSDLTDVAVVVTRYFGGILLGGGGLVRAYSHTTSLGVEAAGIIRMCPCRLCTLTCEYHEYGKLASLIPANGGVVDDAVFEENVRIDFHIDSSLTDRLVNEVSEITAGKVSVSIGKERFFQRDSNSL